MPIAPSYVFNDFKAACGRKKRVIPTDDALVDAKEHFNLKDQNAILEFIANDGLQDLSLKNSKPWEKNPNPQVEIMVDAYSFRTGGTPGYIAFFYTPLTSKWIIKSFKLNEEANFPLREALAALGECSSPKKLKGD